MYNNKAVIGFFQIINSINFGNYNIFNPTFNCANLSAYWHSKRFGSMIFLAMNLDTKLLFNAIIILNKGFFSILIKVLKVYNIIFYIV